MTHARRTAFRRLAKAVATMLVFGRVVAVTVYDGLVRGEEECDDGNQETGDGCDDQCETEI